METFWTITGGAIAGGVVSLGLEILRWRHSRRTRWHDTRRVAYAEFLAQVHKAFNWWIMSESGVRLLSRLGDPKELHDRVISAMASVNLLAEEDAKDAADHLLELVEEAIAEATSRLSESSIIKGRPIDDHEKDRLMTEFIERRQAFERLAREELDIT